MFYFVFKRHVCCMILLIFISSFSTFTIITSAYTIIICMKVSTTMTITVTIFALTHYFFQSKSHLTYQFHIAFIFSLIFLIIFFLLNLVEEVISVFCSPFPSVLYIPLGSLHFPIWNFIFNCKRWNVPY